MGGEGSGRKPSITTLLERERTQLIARGPPHGGGDQLILPNLSGVKPGALKSSSGTGLAEQTPATLTAGSVIFANSSNQLTQDNANFFWDDSNNRLGIGTSSPSFPLDVQADTGTNAIKVRGRSNAGVDEGTLTFVKNDGTTTQGYLQTDTTNLGIYAITDLKLGGGNSVDMTILSSGKVGIGTDAPASLFSLSGSGVLLNIDVTNSNNYKMNFRDAGIITGYLGSNLDRPFVVTNSAITGENFSVLSGGIVGMMNYNANPTIPLGVLSGGIFISGGALFYKGDQGTVTQIAAR